MSKISYCSLEEAWGEPYKTNNIKNEKINENSEIERKEVIKNMNIIERNNGNNYPINTNDYNKYRLNPKNNIEQTYSSNNKQEYSPFNESIEKKYLQDKLNFLENEFKKYKEYFDNEHIEKFSNNIEDENNIVNKSIDKPNDKPNDIIDLILLIIIGLIVIFVMNSIFNIGKSIGSRNKVI